MTLQEQTRYAANFMKRRTSRIVSHQNGLSDVMAVMHFGADPYNGDRQDGAPRGTTKVNPADQGVDGTVAREGGVVPGAPSASNDDNGDITGALDVLQKHIAGLGNADLLAVWASTSDVLKKTVSGDAVVKAKVNAAGTTRDPLRVADNDAASNAGPQGYINSSDLSRKGTVAQMEAQAANVTKLTSRIVECTAL